jgi:hypothetical protein
MKLSIGQAWDEAKGILRADGKAIFAIALALAVLPGAILETAAPSSLRNAQTSTWLSLLGLVAALLGIASQLAISRIALGPSTTVGKALALAFRRLPFLFSALLLAVLPFAVMLVLLTRTQGAAFDPRALPPALALAILAIILAGFFVLVRLMFVTPLAAHRDLGPVGLIKEGWRLSRGRWGKLFLLILLLMLVALLLVGALGGALSAMVILALGEIAPGNLSALLVALIQQVLAALVSVLFVVVVCRLYAQAVNGTVEASVPQAGRD